MARNKIEFALRVKDEASHNIQKVTKEVDALSGSLKRLAGGVVSAATALEIARQADMYRLLQNRLRLVTKGTDELRAVTDELVKVSLRSRTSFRSTLDLYARVARSSRELGISQQKILDITETVSKSIRISGSTAQEAAAGVIQFGQALASSRLSGDELRSVLEQMPRLAQAIAQGMGVGIGQLREMGEAGTLTADKVIDALTKMAPEIEAEFLLLQPLVSEAFTNLESAIFSSIGTLDEYLGASRAVAAAVVDLAEDTALLGDALTGTLGPTEKMGTAMQRIAIFTLVTAQAITVLAKSASVVIPKLAQSIGEFLGAFSAQVVAGATGGGMDAIDAISEEFNATLDEIWSEEDLDKRRDEIIMGVTDMFEKIGQLMGEFPTFAPDPVDLTQRQGEFDPTTRNQREAIAKANLLLERFQTNLLNQVQAFNIAQATGREYADVLEEVKLELLGAAAGNEELATNLIRVFREFKAAEQAAEDLAKQLEEEQRILEKFAKQAARNIQDAFADFLFDPFEDGLEGMVKGFIDAMRRMLANALAFQILSNIPGIGGFLSQRAAGGPVSAGQPVLVGERGPELFIPGASGSIRNNSAMNADSMGGGSTFITNIDARGADPGLIARLPTIMEQRDKKLMLKMKRFIETGSVTI